MTVLLNRWNGKQFENDTECSLCEKLSTVVVLGGESGDDYELYICKSCLLNLVKEIDQTIIGQEPQESLDIPDRLKLKTESMSGSYGFKIGRLIIDKNNPNIKADKNGRLYYRRTCGHGDYSFGYLFPLDTPDEEVDRLSKIYREEDK